jgi:oligosaccharide repeat unit polymerase
VDNIKHHLITEAQITKKESTQLNRALVVAQFIVFSFAALFIFFKLTIPLLCMCLLFQITGTIYLLSKKTPCFLYIIFNLTFFLFLSGRYFIAIISSRFTDYGGYLSSGFSRNTIQKVFVLYFISILFFHITYLILRLNIIQKKLDICKDRLKFNREKNLNILLLKSKDERLDKLMFVVIIFGMLFASFFKINYYLRFAQYAKSVGYSQSYLFDFSKNNQIIYLISRSFEIFYFLLISRRVRLKVFIPLSTYFVVISGFELLTGRRMQFMQNVFVVILFFLITYWEGFSSKTKKSILVVSFLGLITLILILQIVSINRYGDSNEYTLIELILKFFFEQGVSTKTIGYVVENENVLPNTGRYSFGPFFDFLTILSGNKPPARSSLDSAFNGYVISDAISFFAHPANYMKGISLGSSYIAELYADFGLSGVIWGNIFVGILIFFTETAMMSKTVLLTYFSLLVAREIIILPRSQFLKFIFAFSPTNMLLLFLVLLSLMLVKGFYINLNKKNNVRN